MTISPILLPVPSRVIALSNHIPPRAYGTATPPVLIQLPARRAVDEIDYWIDAAVITGPDLDDHVVDVRTDVSPDADLDDMAVTLVDTAAGLIGFIFGGGVPGTEYRVVVTFVTDSGRTVSAEIVAPVIGAGIPDGDEDADTWEHDVPRLLRFARGDAIALTWHFTDDSDADIDVSGAAITGAVRTANGRDVLGVFDVTMTNLNAWAIAKIPDTTAWPLGQHIADIRVAFDGRTVISDTFPIFIDRPRVPE